MPELRRDPITGRWVIVATERARRPENFSSGRSAPKPQKVENCPFCEGHEKETPPEVFAAAPEKRQPDSPGWNVRVVPNKFPALSGDGEPKIDDEGLYQTMPGRGIHEVIIETPLHHLSPADLTQEGIEDLITAYKERYSSNRHHSGIKHVLIFRNHGREAGASLEHPHSQLIASPLVPPVIAEELEGARDYFERNSTCVYCDIIKKDTADGRRIVFETDSFVVIEPFASRVPFETWIIPKKHGASFEKISGTDIPALGGALRSVLSAISSALGDPAYNYFIHTAPVTDDESPYYHWHIEIIPKLTITAGFELGAGVYINISLPEETANFLRNALPHVL